MGVSLAPAAEDGAFGAGGAGAGEPGPEEAIAELALLPEFVGGTVMVVDWWVVLVT